MFGEDINQILDVTPGVLVLAWKEDSALGYHSLYHQAPGRWFGVQAFPERTFFSVFESVEANGTNVVSVDALEYPSVSSDFEANRAFHQLL
jgi:hypothetical protein